MLTRDLLKADCAAVQPAVMALIKPVGDHEADTQYKDTAH